jgi:hypothetical protein
MGVTIFYGLKLGQDIGGAVLGGPQLMVDGLRGGEPASGPIDSSLRWYP